MSTIYIRSRVLRLPEASSVKLDSPRTSPGNESVKLPWRHRIVTEWPQWTWWNRWWHSHLKSGLFCILSSAHSSGVKISCHFANSELQHSFLVAPHRDQPSGTYPARLIVGQHLYSGTRQPAQMDAKANFWFGNIVPKQWILLGLPQHTSANTIYIT